MIIDNKWVMEYIKAYGNKIIIPKEAIIIKNRAFDFESIANTYPEYEDGSKQLQIEFEEGSKLETIETGAFYVQIANEIILPPSIKRIEEYAFYGFPNLVQLQKGSSLEECGDDIVFRGQKDIDVPLNVKKLELSSGLIEHLDSIMLPLGFKIENIEIPNGVDRIIFPNAQELLSTNEKSIRSLRLKDNKAMILYINGEEDLFYEIVDMENQKILFSRKFFCISKL